MTPPHHLTQNLFFHPSSRQPSRYLSPSVQPQPSMWLSIPRWARVAWTEATDVRQRPFRFWSRTQLQFRTDSKCAAQSESHKWLLRRPLSLWLGLPLSPPLFGRAPSWHHLADDSGIPISNYKQDFCSIRGVW